LPGDCGSPYTLPEKRNREVEKLTLFFLAVIYKEEKIQRLEVNRHEKI